MLDPGQDAPARDAVAKEVKGQIEASGALKHENVWGLRKMAYEINRRTEADYRWFRFEAARFISSWAQRCHFPTMAVLTPRSTSTSARVAHSGGTCPLPLGNPVAASVMQAMPFVVWLRPVSRQDRVGEHRAVVCHCV